MRRIRPDGGAEDVLYALYANRAAMTEVLSGYWECFQGTITVESYPMEEICFITEGSAVIADRGREGAHRPPRRRRPHPQGRVFPLDHPGRVKKVYFIAH
ncbi:MAG: hypothetical protein V8Q84_01400 [Bilophila sp.]